MSQGKRPFTQTDVQAALKAAVKAGLTVWGYEIDQAGKIKVVTGARSDEHDDKQQNEGENEWDNL